MPSPPSRLSTVLYLGPPESLAQVKALLPGVDVRFSTTDEDTEAALPSCDAVLDAYMKIRFPADRLARATKLRAFVTATTGADHVDAKSLEARGIPLLTLKGRKDVLFNVTAAAEHSWLLLLACARGLPAAVNHVLDGNWDRNRFPGTMLGGRTLGVVGMGRIAQWMSRYAIAFNMRVVGFDPFADTWPDGARKVSLEELVAESDFVTVHVNLGDTTRGLLSRKLLEAIKPGAVVINTSRGEILDEAALLDGLKSGRIAGAGLDVLTGEPQIDRHPLVEYARTHPNVVITPHIGGFSPDALKVVLDFCCRRLTGYFEGKGHG